MRRRDLTVAGLATVGEVHSDGKILALVLREGEKGK